MPLHNKAEYVGQALRSALRQQSCLSEIIVVDDASTDGSATFAEQIPDDRIKIIRRARPGPGGYAARNAAIAAATSEWIAFLDADDVWRGDHLSHLLSAAEMFGVDVVFGSHVKLRDASGAPADHGADKRPRRLTFNDFLHMWIKQRECPMLTSAVMCRRGALLDAGLFPAGRAARGGDKDLWLRLAARNDIAFSGAATLAFRLDGAQKVTRIASTAQPPLLCETIRAMLAHAQDQETAALLRRLNNMEVNLYARQTFGRAAIPAAMGEAMFADTGWRDRAECNALAMIPISLGEMARRRRSAGKAAHQALASARRLAGIIRRAPKALRRTLHSATLLRTVERSPDIERRDAQQHKLPGPVIVSLTSYPPRFGRLGATLKCLLSQDVAPDQVILWLARGDAGDLPDSVRAMQRHGLSIQITDDIRSYKKIIPILSAEPGAFVVTADDDVFYPSDWLGSLLGAYRGTDREIICRRAHRVRMSDFGAPAPYHTWQYEIADESNSALHFPTGVGGVLYAPGALHPDVFDQKTFAALCPTGDDIWLYWMALRAGSTVRRVGAKFKPVSWPGTQGVSLSLTNTSWRGANDVQIARMVRRYGFPPAHE